MTGLRERTWEFVPLWQIAVLFVYAPRRVDCPECGVVVERVPWCDGKFRQTTSYRWFLARWAKRLSWQEVAEIFHTSWDSVYRHGGERPLWVFDEGNAGDGPDQTAAQDRICQDTSEAASQKRAARLRAEDARRCRPCTHQSVEA